MKKTALLVTLLAARALAGEGWVTHAVALSPDLRTLVRGRMHAERGTARLRIEDAGSGTVRPERGAHGPIRALAFRGDGAYFAATADHGPLEIRDTASGEVAGKLAGHRGRVHAIAFAGGAVASAGRDDTLRVWDARRAVERWRRNDARVGALALSPDAARLATTDRFGRVTLWDAATGEQVRKLDTGDSRWGFVVAFSRDGARVAAGNRRVRVFDAGSGKVVATLDGREKRATAIAFSPDGTRLATADRGRRVRLWRLAATPVERAWTAKREVGALVFSADGATLGAATYDGRGHFWKLPAAGKPTAPRRDR